MNGKEIKAYFKEDAYKDTFSQFRDIFEAIVTKRGGTVEKTLERFGNPLMCELIFE